MAGNEKRKRTPKEETSAGVPAGAEGTTESDKLLTRIRDAIAGMERYAENSDTDILFYNGEINEDGFKELVGACRADKRQKMKNVLLILVTHGGDAHWAYKLARFLQDQYESFEVFVPGPCKSAGTLLVVGARRIIMSDYGELGPLDMQVRKKDEYEYGSGAAISSGFDELAEKSYRFFHDFMQQIIAASRGRITFRTSAEMAASLMGQLLGQVYGRIDPYHLGELRRSLMIAWDYGERLGETGENLEEETLKDLIYKYPEHGFVIDRTEAKSMFKRVCKPARELEMIQASLGGFSVYEVPMLEGPIVFRLMPAPSPEVLDFLGVNLRTSGAEFLSEVAKADPQP